MQNLNWVFKTKQGTGLLSLKNKIKFTVYLAWAAYHLHKNHWGKVLSFPRRAVSPSFSLPPENLDSTAQIYPGNDPTQEVPEQKALAGLYLYEAASHLQLPHWDMLLSFPGKSTVILSSWTPLLEISG